MIMSAAFVPATAGGRFQCMHIWHMGNQTTLRDCAHAPQWLLIDLWLERDLLFYDKPISVPRTDGGPRSYGTPGGKYIISRRCTETILCYESPYSLAPSTS